MKEYENALMERAIVKKNYFKALVLSAGLVVFLNVAQLQSVDALSTWAMKIGGPGTDDIFRGIDRLSDGYVVVGSTNSFGAGANDAWVIKLDGDANIESQRTFGGNGGERI